MRPIRFSARKKSIWTSARRSPLHYANWRNKPCAGCRMVRRARCTEICGENLPRRELRHAALASRGAVHCDHGRARRSRVCSRCTEKGCVGGAGLAAIGRGRSGDLRFQYGRCASGHCRGLSQNAPAHERRHHRQCRQDDNQGNDCRRAGNDLPHGKDGRKLQ